MLAGLILSAIAIAASGVQSQELLPYAEGTFPVNEEPSWEPVPGARQGKIPIAYANSRERTGMYYLPAGWENRPLPVFIILHGSGMGGNDMVYSFGPLAETYKFIVVAPDSHDEMFWFSPAAGANFTSDWHHVEACQNWVRNIPGVQVDTNRFAIAGFSRGGMSAAGLASRVPYATHAIVLHSALDPTLMGSRYVPILVTTGGRDPVFNTGKLRPRLQSFSALQPAFQVTFKWFSGQHNTRSPPERKAMMQWWLSTAPFTGGPAPLEPPPTEAAASAQRRAGGSDSGSSQRSTKGRATGGGKGSSKESIKSSSGSSKSSRKSGRRTGKPVSQYRSRIQPQATQLPTKQPQAKLPEVVLDAALLVYQRTVAAQQEAST